MNRDIFNRSTRFVHKFGATERLDDLTGSRTFEPKAPIFPAQRSGPITQPQQGEYRGEYGRPRSPVEKFRGGHADFSGPEPARGGAIGVVFVSKTRK